MGKSVVSLEYQQVYNAFFNLIRFLSLAKTDHRKQKIAAALIMTYPGVPSVYYGDEKVIEGMNLSDSTRKMIQEDGENSMSMHEFYKKPIHIRRNNPVLTYGEYKPLIADIYNNQFGFLRITNEDQLLCLFNNVSAKQDMKLNVINDTYIDLMTEELFKKSGDSLTIPMQPFGTRILKIVKAEQESDKC